MELRYIGKYESNPTVGEFHSNIIHPNEVREFPDDIALLLLQMDEYEMVTETVKPFVHPAEEMEAILEQRRKEAEAHAALFSKQAPQL